MALRHVEDQRTDGAAPADHDATPPRRTNHRGRRHAVGLAAALDMAARVLGWAGVVLVLFVAYQLWGSGVSQARHQRELRAAFSERTMPTATTAVPGATTTTAVATTVAPTPVQLGDPVASIRIPRIDVDQVVAEGTTDEVLAGGPGHYPATPLPGEPGNAAVAGHRSTHGAPFRRLDELVAGDEIVTTTAAGTSRYLVRTLLIVPPTEGSVLLPTAGNHLTLTTCTPVHSDRDRLIVVADMVGPSAAATSSAVPTARLALADGDIPSSANAAPVAGWGVALLGADQARRALSRRWRPALALLATLPVIILVVSQLLPALDTWLPS